MAKFCEAFLQAGLVGTRRKDRSTSAAFWASSSPLAKTAANDTSPEDLTFARRQFVFQAPIEESRSAVGIRRQSGKPSEMLNEGIEAYKKEGSKFMQRLVAKQKVRAK